MRIRRRSGRGAVNGWLGIKGWKRWTCVRCGQRQRKCRSGDGMLFVVLGFGCQWLYV
jgi:hypothetical protein